MRELLPTCQQIDNTGTPGFLEPWLSEICRKTWKNRRKQLICSGFVWVFQAEDFGKLSAPAFRIFVDWSRSPGTNRPIFACVPFFDPKKYEHPTCSFYFWKNRLRNHAQSLDCLARPNLTDLVTKQVSLFAVATVSTITRVPDHQGFPSHRME